MTISTAVRESTLVLHIVPEQLTQHAPRTPSGSQEFLAVLTQPGQPGAPSTLTGSRIDGEAYDRIVMDYRVGDGSFERSWTKASDLGSEVVYTMSNDTSSRGYATCEA